MSLGVTAAVHWLSGTSYLDEDEMAAFIDDLVPGHGFEVSDRGLNGYRRRLVGPEGLLVLSDPAVEGMPPVCVVARGAACEFLGAERVRALVSVLKPTRVDFAWDGAPFTVAEVTSWIESGNMRTRARKAQGHRPLLEDPDAGETAELGTHSSTWMLDVYDRRGPVRAELRLKGERAAAAYSVLQQDPATWSSAFMGILRGLVDFVDRSHAQRAEDCPTLPSWDAFVAGAQRVVVRLAGNVAPSFERARDWVIHQVSPTLVALVAAGLPLREVMHEGRRRTRQKHRAMAATWRVGALPALGSV